MKQKAVVISGIILIFLGMNIYFSSSSTLNSSVLRFHVIANSDDVQDQALKIEVKNEIVSSLKNDFVEQEDVQHARNMAIENIPRIKSIAETVIASYGYKYPVKVEVGDYMFPTKSYGNMVFPQGEYQAVRVVLGEGKGKNWWCVLFPPLCMVSDSDKGLSFEDKKEARVSLKCLELLPKGVRLKLSSH